jgi:hypothetical protein
LISVSREVVRASEFPMRWCGQMREAAEAAGDTGTNR